MRKLLKPLLATLCALVITTATALAQQVPDHAIGGWINSSTHDWEYGFFEEFAIYDRDFWRYERIEVSRRGHIDLVLQKGDERMALKINKVDENRVKIKEGKGAWKSYQRMEKGYPDYPTADDSTFPAPTFSPDTTTLVGYYRNLYATAEPKGRIVKVTVNDLVAHKEEIYEAEIDSLNRFVLRFPVADTRLVRIRYFGFSVDAVVVPNERLLFYFDFTHTASNDDPSHTTFGGIGQLWKGQYMGKAARINNELTQYEDSLVGNSWEKRWWEDREASTDMEVLRAREKEYLRRMEHLKSYIERKPLLSARFKEYYTHLNQYELIFDLMERHHLLERDRISEFEEGYMAYVDSLVSSIQDNVYLCMASGVQPFSNNYIDYYERRFQRTLLSYQGLRDFFMTHIALSAEERAVFEEIDAINQMQFDGQPSGEVIARVDTLRDALRQIMDRHREEVGEVEQKLVMEIADSLPLCASLRDIWKTKLCLNGFDNHNRPLSQARLEAYRQGITSPYLFGRIAERQAHYEEVARQQEVLPCFKSTDHLSDYTEAEALFAELIKPYKGKVIYLDFWGTWCHPCLENMKESKKLKEKLKGEDIVYMYLANRSNEEHIRHLVVDLGVVGDDVVHYNLPDKQQSLIERHFGVFKFPTYMLIDKQGNVVNRHAAPPTMVMAEEQIRELLR